MVEKFIKAILKILFRWKRKSIKPEIKISEPLKIFNYKPSVEPSIKHIVQQKSFCTNYTTPAKIKKLHRRMKNKSRAINYRYEKTG